jgi:hypothetical protein
VIFGQKQDESVSTPTLLTKLNSIQPLSLPQDENQVKGAKI